jgi:hypothetical protein
MSEKIYCGNAKIVNTQFGDLTKISFSKDDINKMVTYMKANSSDWINLVLKEKKEPQPGKPTHYLEVDTWKPTKQAEQHGTTASGEHVSMNVSNPVQDESDDLPF